MVEENPTSYDVLDGEQTKETPPFPRTVSVGTTATKTDEKTTLSVNRTLRPPAPKSPVDTAQKAGAEEPKPPIPIRKDTPLDIKAQRAKEWGEWLFKDANPLIVKGTAQFCGIPSEWMNAQVAEFHVEDPKTPGVPKRIVFWEPTLEERLTLSEKDCHGLAKAAAEFSISPMGMAITAWIKTHAELIAMATALFIAGRYGYKMMQTKSEVDQIKKMMAERAAQLKNAQLEQQLTEQPLNGQAA